MNDEVTLFAHRGSSARFPEHTRAAYQQALDDGADGIETDVRLTADDRLVCWHDATIDRTTGAPGRVRELSLAALGAFDLLDGSDVPASHGDPAAQLMTLEALIALMLGAGRELMLAVELKPSRGTEAELVATVLRILGEEGWDARTGRLGSLSISLMCFSAVAATLLLEHVPAGLIFLLVEEDDADQELLDRADIQVGPAVEEVRARPEAVPRWLFEGRTVRVWTVDTAEDLELCLAVGVREIITNRPAELREHLDRILSS